MVMLRNITSCSTFSTCSGALGSPTSTRRPPLRTNEKHVLTMFDAPLASIRQPTPSPAVSRRTGRSTGARRRGRQRAAMHRGALASADRCAPASRRSCVFVLTTTSAPMRCASASLSSKMSAQMLHDARRGSAGRCAARPIGPAPWCCCARADDAPSPACPRTRGADHRCCCCDGRQHDDEVTPAPHGTAHIRAAPTAFATATQRSPMGPQPMTSSESSAGPTSSMALCATPRAEARSGTRARGALASRHACSDGTRRARSSCGATSTGHGARGTGHGRTLEQAGRCSVEIGREHVGVALRHDRVLRATAVGRATAVAELAHALADVAQICVDRSVDRSVGRSTLVRRRRRWRRASCGAPCRHW